MRIIVATLAIFCLAWPLGAAAEEEPPALNPFGTKSKTRADALSGYALLSDGSIFAGKVYLTRDIRLRIYDGQTQRQREIPLRVVQRVECKVKREWMEKEWRFLENANDEKVFTGREHQAREYLHTITLHDGRQITGPLSGVVYVDPYAGGETRKFLMHKRQKGPLETSLKALTYLRKIELGEKAMQEAFARQQRQQ